MFRVTVRAFYFKKWLESGNINFFAAFDAVDFGNALSDLRLIHRESRIAGSEARARDYLTSLGIGV